MTGNIPETSQIHSTIDTKLTQNYLSKKFNPVDIRICLWGFSQGGAAALVLTLFSPSPLHKVASVCGFLPEIPEDATDSNSSIPILGIYGTNDDVVPSFLAEHALDEMKNKGHIPKIRETPQGHELNAENLEELSKFFNS